MKRFLLALITGLLLAFGWPTYGFPLLLFLGFVPLLYIEHRIRTTAEKHGGRKIFGWAYLSFLVWNIITTYWIYFSTPAGMVFAIVVNSLLMALVFLVYHHIAKKTLPLLSALFLIGLWMGFEYLHLHWQFSWPWLNLGNGFSEYPHWVQWYEYTGTFGGTLWIWIGNFCLFYTLLAYQKKRKKNNLFWGLSILALVILIPIGLSYLILSRLPNEKNETAVEVLILQPDINPYTEKYNTNDTRIGRLLNRMTDAHIDDSTQLVIAPETVFANVTRKNRFKRSTAHFYSQKIIATHPNTSFMAGISLYKNIRHKDRVGPQSNFVKPGLWRNFYNAAFMLSPGRKPQFYDKSKLVVGVETFPYQKILKPLLGNIMLNLGGTVAKLTTQKKRSVFTFDGDKKTAPIICYESVYGQFVAGYVRNGAQFLTVITNDAWWEDTQGHKQHLSYARLRAIETRRDVAQSANNGTSAIINQKGELMKSTPYGVRDIIKGKVHLNNKLTFYGKHGDYIARVGIFLTLIIFLLSFFLKHLPFFPPASSGSNT